MGLNLGFRARPRQATVGERYLDREERLEGLLRRSVTSVYMSILSRNSGIRGKHCPCVAAVAGANLVRRLLRAGVQYRLPTGDSQRTSRARRNGLAVRQAIFRLAKMRAQNGT